MQRDFHYYGTYVLARAAGINKVTAQIISSAAQFVDESIEKRTFNFNDGSSVVPVITAHHLASIENLKRNDQRMVWIPFHFLPGNVGDSFTERLICIKNSEIAQTMVRNAIDNADKSFSDYLIGITAHVYADTFAHFGFSGVSSTKNKIVNDSIVVEVANPEIKKYIEEKAADFLSHKQKSFLIENIRKLISTTVEIAAGALGHGAVATYPDRPYLKWSFEYEHERITELDFSDRDNEVTFLEASEALFHMFKEYVSRKQSIKDDTVNLEFSQISEIISKIINTEGACETRIEEWQKLIRNNIGFVSSEDEIPPYLGDRWYATLKELKSSEYDRVKSCSVCQFYNAAGFHRNYILNELLPDNGIYVV